MGAGDGVRRRDGSRGGNGGMTRPPMVLGRRSSGSCASSDACLSVAAVWDGDRRRDSAGGLPASSLVTEGKDVWSLEDAPRGGGEAPRGRYGRGGPFVKNISRESLSDSWKYPLRVGQSVLRSGSVRGKMSRERWLTRRYLKLQAAGGWPPCQLGKCQRCPDRVCSRTVSGRHGGYIMREPSRSFAPLQSANALSQQPRLNVKTIH